MMIAYGLDKLITFSRESHTKRVFFESDKVKAPVMGLEARQQILLCRMKHDVIFFVLEGRGAILADGEKQAVGKSTFVFVPKERETRALKA